jgi:hypothetical protein
MNKLRLGISGFFVDIGSDSASIDSQEAIQRLALQIICCMAICGGRKMSEKAAGRRINWATLIATTLLSVTLSLAATCINTNYTIRKQVEENLEKADRYAAKLEEQLTVDLARKWADYRVDSTRWQQAWPEESSGAMHDLANKGLSGSFGILAQAKEAIDRKYHDLILDNRDSILRYEQDARLKIQTIRETGVLLQ